MGGAQEGHREGHGESEEVNEGETLTTWCALVGVPWWVCPGGCALVGVPWWVCPGGCALVGVPWWVCPGGCALVGVSCKAMLTGSSSVIIPYISTTLGCENCAMMTASCRNFTLSFSEAPGLSVLIATSFEPKGESHTPFSTVPNWPEPRWPTSLRRDARAHQDIIALRK